jgi:hypothetical protein
MTASVFDWFWQPPIDGQPGLIMVADTHPGPEAIDVPFVLEDLANVLLWIEARIDKSLSLHSFRIYMRDPIGLWGETKFNDPGSRKYTVSKPDARQAGLSELWDARLARGERPADSPRLDS